MRRRVARGKVVSFGGLQSNFLRALASGCARVGMEAHCLYFERRPARLTGNLLLCQQLGARLHFVPLGGDSGPRDLHRTCQLVRLLSPFLPGIGWRGVSFIPVGGHSALGCAGYVPAAREILDGAAATGFRPDVVVTAAGTGGTLAGLLAGFRLLESPVRLIGVDVGKLWRGFEEDIAAMAGEVTALLGAPLSYTAADVALVPGYGPGYARPHEPARSAIELAARAEGLLLDPVYSGKAMAGLIDLIRAGQFTADQHVVFLHTGGWPSLFAEQDVQLPGRS